MTPQEYRVYDEDEIRRSHCRDLAIAFLSHAKEEEGDAFSSLREAAPTRRFANG